MAISLANLVTSTTMRPPRMLLHGVAGVGKTSLAAEFPYPVMVDIEGGAEAIPVDFLPRFPQAKSFAEVLEALESLYHESHQFQTVIVDTVDWLEPLVWEETCRRNGWPSIEAPGYGKGYVEASNVWREFIDRINGLRDDRSMGVVLIAHTDIKRFESPEVDPYDRYIIKLHKRAGELLMEHADLIGFLNYQISTKNTDAGFNKKVTRGVSSGARLIHVEERPAFVAKNRYSMPPSIPFIQGQGFNALAPFIWPDMAPASTAGDKPETTTEAA